MMSQNIKGTGTGGRIVSNDVEVDRKTVTDEGTDSFKSIELSSMRKVGILILLINVMHVYGSSHYYVDNSKTPSRIKARCTSLLFDSRCQDE